MRRPSLLPSLFTLLLLATQAPALHASRDPDSYNLRIHVFSRRVHKRRHFADYYGSGRANIIDGDQISAMDFTYDCGFKFLDSDADEFYPGRWKKQGLSLEILVGVIGSDTKTRTCEFKTELKDFVYIKRNGHVDSISPQEYASTQQAKQERAQALAPTDLDPTHYPLEFALLHLTWTGEKNGLQIATGQGNLKGPNGLNAVDFSMHCPVKIETTPEGRYLLGRWVDPEKDMLLLLRSIDVDGAPGATCELLTAIEPDVYIRTGNNVKAISQEEYKRRAAGSGQ